MNKQAFTGNRICTLFGIRYPLVQAGMVWCSGWELAAAVSNAGGLGLIGSGSMDPEVLRVHIQKCKAATAHPFGVNVPLLYRHAADNLKVAVEEGVKIVFTSAGNPANVIPALRAQGLTVVHVVSSAKFARKAEASGAHAVVAEGFEAGGHNGREELTTFVLIPQARAAVQIPVIAAGGIATGAGMLAAMALGAEGVQIGSRFVASLESSAHEAFKQAVVNASEDETKLMMKSLTPVRLLKNAFFDEVQKAEQQGAGPEALKALLGHGRARKGMFEGDLAAGELEIGQVAALIHHIKPAAEIVEEIIGEYEERIRRFWMEDSGF